jgi:hypothetical protein
MQKRYLFFGLLFSIVSLTAFSGVQPVKVKSITVKNVAKTIVLKKKNVQGLQIEVLPNNASNKEITYTSRNNQIVTVSPAGEITAVSAGSTTISITANDKSGVRVNLPVTVTDRTPEIDSANGPDGPYINYSDTGVLVVSVDIEGYIVEKNYPEIPKDYTFTVYPTLTTPYCPYRLPFQVKLHPLVRPEWKRPAPDTLLVMSDPHAKWGPFVSFLKHQKVVNDSLKWIFGKNELLINGDVFDRSVDAITIFWLIYELQGEAREAGGEVYFNYGNHEEAVLKNTMGHAMNIKYKNFASKYFDTPIGASEYGMRFFNLNTELGRWLAECNTIQIIGKDLFVHAGLSQTFYDMNYVIPEVNAIISRDIFNPNISERDSIFFGNRSPLDYRGMIPGFSNPISEKTLGALLRRYEVERIIVGHTQQTNADGPVAFPEHDYRVICTDLHTYHATEGRRGRGLLIEKNGDTYTAYDLDGNKPNRPMQLPTTSIP